jgi:bifunctional non-homologous end joining protein LigD
MTPGGWCTSATSAPGLPRPHCDGYRGDLAGLERPVSPFAVPVPREHARGAHWVEPLLVGDVEYREFTAGERRLRHPAWKGLRADKPPLTVGLPPTE